MNKVTSILSWFFLDMVTLLLFGCMPDDSPITLTTIPTKNATYTLSHPTITLTVTPTITPTHTPVIPLEPENAYIRMDEFLSNEEQCDLPCWQGIVPGQSTLLDIRTQLISLSNIAVDIEYELPAGSKMVTHFTIPYYPENDRVVSIETSYILPRDESNIEIIRINTRTYEEKNGQYIGEINGYPPYNEILESYTISGILSKYGVPGNVFVESYLREDTTVTPGYGDHFIIHLWYPAIGAFLEYRMPVEGLEDKYRFCPSDAFFMGTLISEDVGENYKDVLLDLDSTYTRFFSNALQIKTPEQAFGMTAEQFSQELSTSLDQCLETPKSIWWPENHPFH